MKNFTTLLLLVVFVSSKAQIFESYPTTSSTILQPSNFINFNNKMYYFARDASFNFSLYATDGTTSGNEIIFPLGFAFTSFPTNANFLDYKVIHNNELYFIFSNKLYKTDGTNSGTTLIRNNFFNAKYPISYNGKVYLIGGDSSNGVELWQSDGTTSGTILLKNINNGSQFDASTGAGNGFNSNFDPHFTIFNNQLFFVANDGIHGYELWSTDGTSSGTNLFKDIRQPARESTFGAQDGQGFGAFCNSAYAATPFKVVNGKMYFVANKMTNILGVEYFPTDSFVVFSTDGTVANTDFVSIDVPPGAGVGNAPNNYLFAQNNLTIGFSEYNNELYVSSARPARQPFNGVTYSGIYKINNSNPFYRVGNLNIPNVGSNGVSEDAPRGSMFWFNNEFYFLGANTLAFPSDNEFYLYKLNPATEIFTLMSTASSGFNGSGFTGNLLAKIVGNKFYYYKNQSMDVFETDGTLSGTVQLARSSNLSSPNADQNITSGVLGFGTVANSLYFNAGIAFGQNALYRIFNNNLINATFTTNYFKIYPNPATDNLNLNFENNVENGTLKIISLTGQTIFEKQNISGTNFKFDVSSLNSGIYMIQLSDSNKTINSKFIKN